MKITLSPVITIAAFLFSIFAVWTPSSAVAAISCPGVSPVVYGSQTYDTVLIGSQCWLKQNLNIGTQITSCTGGYVGVCATGGDTVQNQNSTNGIIEKYCYNDNSAKCDTDGGLYQWDEAMQLTGGAPGICPVGWHIPTDSEWYTLEKYLTNPGNTCDPTRIIWDCYNAGTKLKTGGSSGFNGILTGRRTDDGRFDLTGGTTAFWSSTTRVGNNKWVRTLTGGDTGTNRNSYKQDFGLPVRCLYNSTYTQPTVTINQAAAQPDPANASPINFTVIFSTAVSDFATGDVTLSGTAGATTATVTGSGTTYNVAVTGMTVSGTVIAAIAQGVAHDGLGVENVASTSTDNQVTYDITAPVVTISRVPAGTVYSSDSITITSTATDSSGIQDHKIKYRQSASGPWQITQWAAGGTHSITIGPFPAGTLIEYYATAADNAGTGNYAETAVSSFTVTGVPPTISAIGYDLPLNYCSVPTYTFKWTFNDPGDTESKFQIQIDNNSDFSSPTVDRTFSGLSNPDGTVNQQAVLLGTAPDAPNAGNLVYGTNYYWQAQVWDSAGASSGWQSGANFTTEPHAWPSVAFSPPPPSTFTVNVPIAFKSDINNAPNNSVCYGAGNAVTVCSSWSWNFCRGAVPVCTNNTASGEDVNHTYDAAGTYDVALTVSDAQGNSCTNAAGTKVLGAVKPKWKEVTPR